MSSHWLQLPSRPMDYCWAYGEVICKALFCSPSLILMITVNFTIFESSTTAIVLSQLDSRYFSDVNGRAFFSLDFVVYKRGEEEPRGHSYVSTTGQRSVTCQLDLDAGEYAVYVRKSALDVIRKCTQALFQPRIDRFQTRQLVRFFLTL